MLLLVAFFSWTLPLRHKHGGENAQRLYYARIPLFLVLVRQTISKYGGAPQAAAAAETIISFAGRWLPIIEI